MSFHSWIRITILLTIFFYTKTKVGQIFSLNEAMSWLVGFLVFVVMAAWLFTYRYNVFPMDSVPFKIVTWAGSITMAVWTTFMILALFVDIGTIVFGIGQKLLVQKLLTTQPFQSERRQLFAQCLPFALLGISGVMAGFGYRQAARGAKVKKVEIKTPKTTDLSGLKIAQISDLHVGPTIQKDYVQSVVDRVMEQNPDIIAITGDLADGSPEMLKDHVAPLANLKAPLGVYYITGNHEYYSGAEAWIQKGRTLGFTPLINENKILNYKGKDFMVAGITDPSSQDFIASHVSDPMQAVKSDKDTSYKILLAHRPESYIGAEKAGFDLQLSGHTHSGQFFPANLFISLFHRYYKGLNQHNNLQVYVNTGTGYWGPADRLGVPAEISLLEFS